MTIKEVLKIGIDILKSANIDVPVIEAGIILSHVINRNRTFLYSHSEDAIKAWEANLFLKLVNERSTGTPVQYITGHQEFMSLDFIVNPYVLIPRQDTETLVEAVLNHAAEIGKKDLSILDIGTGSGCIAVSLAHYIKECRVTALDISEQALEVAHLNAINNSTGGRIAFLKSNLYEGLEIDHERGEALSESKKGFTGSTPVATQLHPASKHFDVIVSNPPYIPLCQIASLQREVKDNEPLCALDGGLDGLYFYRAILDGAADFLSPNGLIAFEVGYNQANAVAALMNDKYYNISIIKDLSQIERVVTGLLFN